MVANDAVTSEGNILVKITIKMSRPQYVDSFGTGFWIQVWLVAVTANK